MQYEPRFGPLATGGFAARLASFALNRATPKIDAGAKGKARRAKYDYMNGGRKI